MGPLLLIGMFNLISFFRGLNLDNSPYKFGNGGFWKVFGPLGFFLGVLLSRNELDPKLPFVFGIILNIVIFLTLSFLG